MSSIKVVLRTYKKTKNGEFPLYLQIIKDRKARYMSLNFSCTLAMWDKEKNLPKKSHPLYTEILVLIDNKKIEANRLLMNYNTENKEYTAEQVKETLNAVKRKAGYTVLAYFDEVEEKLNRTNRIGYAKIFRSTRNSLSTFRRGKDFCFSDVNHIFLTKYEESFNSRGVALNSIFVFMRTFKTLLNYAKKDGIVNAEYNPFKDFGFSKYRRIKTKKRALGKDQIYLIANAEVEIGTSLFHSKNYFMFSYYNRGINFMDMAFLKWESISKNRLEYKRKKTNDLFTMSILDPALKILDYYKENYYEGEDSYIFPILNKSHISPVSIDNRIDKVLKAVNKDLKAIAKNVGIEEKLTTYVARHSFATILKKSGISTSVISELMGHEDEKTTQIYLDGFENEILDEAAKMLL